MDDRPGRQARWQELTKSHCFELLARERLGRVVGRMSLAGGRGWVR